MHELILIMTVTTSHGTALGLVAMENAPRNIYHQ
jgi:hypothetical protein